eukprot:TRINITY_DN9804_c0_g1_i8.p1 TRINITY_DN9804_c0_g1~~TRINITY_DN9804_c0_g1_i8.p1  ORF type:complete len:298 (+),score=47.23 TRINITY_DN9804_c0_g1_i8:236-1129(+)
MEMIFGGEQDRVGECPKESGDPSIPDSVIDKLERDFGATKSKKQNLSAKKQTKSTKSNANKKKTAPSAASSIDSEKETKNTFYESATASENEEYDEMKELQNFMRSQDILAATPAQSSSKAAASKKTTTGKNVKLPFKKRKSLSNKTPKKYTSQVEGKCPSVSNSIVPECSQEDVLNSTDNKLTPQSVQEGERKTCTEVPKTQPQVVTSQVNQSEGPKGLQILPLKKRALKSTIVHKPRPVNKKSAKKRNKTTKNISLSKSVKRVFPKRRQGQSLNALKVKFISDDEIIPIKRIRRA